MNYFFHRLITQMLPVAFLASFLVFMVVRLIPGDPAMFAAGGENQTSEEAMQLARERMGPQRSFPYSILQMARRRCSGRLRHFDEQRRAGY